MGESACLLRSFSAPDEAREVNPPCASLGESISFGRFMSESLAWEKWSTFSHNRYQEEAEKISKPGSVAQMKAYFEAHYKRIAAKKAAALLEEASAGANVPESEVTAGIHNNSSMDPEPETDNSRVATDEQRENDNLVAKVVFCAEASVLSPDVERHEVEISKVEAPEPVVEQIFNHIENVEDENIIVPAQGEKMADKDAAVEDSMSKKRPAKFPGKSLVYGSSPKIPHPPTKQTTSMQPGNGNNAASISKKFAENFNKKRSAPKSLHMSINFASAGETSKKASPIFQRNGNTGVPTRSLKISKDSSNSRQILTTASVSGVLKQSPIKPEPEDRRTKTFLNKSVAGRLTTDGKYHSLSLECSRCSNASESKKQSSTISSPFSFRSEERAAKRREFFQKLEEKSITKEAEKVQPQTRSKNRTEHEIKRLRHSSGFKTKSNEDVCRASQLSSIHTKKMPPTRPQSPNLRIKPAPIPVRDASSLPPRRPSVKTESSRHVIVKNNRTTTSTSSVTSLSKKVIHENASPNIQC